MPTPGGLNQNQKRIAVTVAVVAVVMAICAWFKWRTLTDQEKQQTKDDIMSEMKNTAQSTLRDCAISIVNWILK